MLIWVIWLNISNINYLWRFLGFGTDFVKQKQTQSKPIYSFCVLRTAKRNLKKQSQFVGEQIGVNSYLKGYYGNITAC